jgi:hypothetical protein
MNISMQRSQPSPTSTFGLLASWRLDQIGQHAISLFPYPWPAQSIPWLACLPGGRRILTRTTAWQRVKICHNDYIDHLPPSNVHLYVLWLHGACGRTVGLRSWRSQPPGSGFIAGHFLVQRIYADFKRFGLVAHQVLGGVIIVIIVVDDLILVVV